MSKLIKVCGIRRAEDAQVAIDAGADFIGVIMVPNRQRTIELDEAIKIGALISAKRSAKNPTFPTIKHIIKHMEGLQFESFEEYSDKLSLLLMENGPFFTCVFRNQPMTEVFNLAKQAGADIIQLHGNENEIEYCRANKEHFDTKFGIIPRYVVPEEVDQMYDALDQVLIGGSYFGNGFLVPLLDSEMGGEGKRLDWEFIGSLAKGRFILAGGLTCDNIEELSGLDNVIGFDVSGGVETNGVKDHTLIKSFVQIGKTVT